MTPAVRQVREAQGARLKRLRLALDLNQSEAYDMAGVSRHSWARMEKGEANIDAVALARFCAKCQPPIPGEYVLSGNMDGLPGPLKLRLFEAERSAPAAPVAGTAAGPDHAPSGSPPQRSTERSASAEKRGAPLAKAQTRG